MHPLPRVDSFSIRDYFSPAGNFANVGDLLTSIISFAIAAAGLVFFAMFVWGGIRYSMARGDDKAVMEAKRTLTNAIVGLLIIVAAFIIINLVSFATRGSAIFS